MCFHYFVLDFWFTCYRDHIIHLLSSSSSWVHGPRIYQYKNRSSFTKVKQVSAMSTWSWGTWQCVAEQGTCTSSASQHRPCPVSSRWVTTKTSPACTQHSVPPEAVLTSSRMTSGRWAKKLIIVRIRILLIELSSTENSSANIWIFKATHIWLVQLTQAATAIIPGVTIDTL